MRVKSYLNCCMVTLMLLFFGSTAFAQSTVSGTVKGDDGEAVSGATVLVKGTSSGAFTDSDGKYTVSVPEGATALVFSFYGFEQQEVALSGQSTLDVTLASSIATLDEVIVTGYGTQKAKEVTSAIVSVKAEDFNQGNIADASQLLQGKVAGLSVARTGGDPNEDFTIRLRGLSTFGANTSPLIILDGVQLAPGTSLSIVDPNDISAIDVLKDGSAAAIYGTRGSAGVIIITTKKGIPGNTSIEYNGQVSITNSANELPVMTADEYVAAGGADLGSETNWFDEITETGTSQVHTISLSGGNASGMSYRFSGNFRDVSGVLKNDGFNQINGRLNITQKAINNRLTLSLNLGTTTRNATFGIPDALEHTVTYKPTSPVFDSPDNGFGGYAQETLFRYFNPVAIVEQSTSEGKLKRFLANIRADFEIFDGLKVGGFFAQQRESDLFGSYFDKEAFFRGRDRNGLARRASDDRLSELGEATIEYTTDFGNTNFKILGGYSHQTFLNEGFSAEGGDFLSDFFSFNNLGQSNDFNTGLGSVNSYKNSHKLIAFFARVNLNIDDTYFFTASYRREGSSRFGLDNQWGDFPAVSAAVNLTNIIGTSTFDNLKFRVGYGRTGSLPRDSYLSLRRFGPSGGQFFYNGAFVPSFGPVSNPNPGLRWETKDEIDIGIDFSLLDFRLNGSFDFYNRNTSDLLFEVQVPVPPNQFDRTWGNVGELRSSGFEGVISYDAIQSDNISWTTALNFSTFNVELVSLTNEDFEIGSNGELIDFTTSPGSPGLNNNPMIQIKEGNPIGNFFGPVFEGVTSDGKYQLRDNTGEGEITREDFEVLGNGLPDFELGWNNTFTFGNLDVNFFLRGSFGHDIINSWRLFYEPIDPGTIGTWNRVKTDLQVPELRDAPLWNSLYVENGDFLRLDNATVGYTFDLPNTSTFNKVRIYINGQNLFTITDYTGFDPEVRFADERNGSILAPGIDRRENNYFTTRTLTFGVNLGF